MSNQVTIGEQIEMGIRKNPKYVPAVPYSPPPTRAEIIPHTSVDMNVVPTSTAHIDVRTSAVDRAQGFLIASVPRTFAFSLAVSILSIAVGGVTLATSFVILFSVFAIAELISYVFTLLISPEGTALYEARQKWDVIKREQKERWAHYNRLNGGN